CRSLTRVLAPRSRYDEVVEAVGAAMSAIPQGDPTDPANIFGPLVSERQRDRVESYLELGRQPRGDGRRRHGTREAPAPPLFRHGRASPHRTHRPHRTPAPTAPPPGRGSEAAVRRSPSSPDRRRRHGLTRRRTRVPATPRRHGATATLPQPRSICEPAARR
ncbi:aldehyde dehydrogenase family protein, partial [Streptomyces sp. NPDC005071]